MKKTTLLSVFALIFSMSMSAQSILEWNFYGTTSVPVTGKETTSDACVNDVDLEKSVLTRGNGAPGNNGYSNGFVGTIQPSSTKADAVAGNVYLEFKVQPKVGNTVSISELFAQLRTQDSCWYQWSYSKDNGSFIDIETPVQMENTSTGVDQTPLNLSTISDLQNLSNSNIITFRIYVWGNKIVQGFGFGKSGGTTTSGYKASIVVKGSVVRSSDIISGWRFDSYSGTTSGSLSASSVDSNLASAVLTRGVGFTPAGLNFGYVSTSPLSGATKKAAITNNEYFELTLRAKDGYKASLASLVYKYRRNTDGPANYKWKYSLNGTDFTEIGSTDTVATATGDGEFYALNLADVPDLQNINAQKTVTLRMYIWGSKINTQVFGFGRIFVGSVGVPVNTIYLKGKVDAVSGINDISESKKAFQVFTSGNQIILTSELQQNDLSEIRISDISGKNICKFNMQIQSGENTLSIPMTLAKGIYLVSVIEKNGTKSTVKFNR